MKMEPIEVSETSAFRTQTPGNYPKENILHKEHGKSLKRSLACIFFKVSVVILRQLISTSNSELISLEEFLGS